VANGERDDQEFLALAWAQRRASWIGVLGVPAEVTPPTEFVC
jgi:hypothetical protein